MGAPPSTEEAKASTELRRGSLAAIVGSLVGLALPVLLLLLSRAGVAGLSVGSSADLQVESLLVVTGAVLVLLAFFLYRRAFGHLKHVDRRLRVASALCLAGSLGALAVVVAGAYVTGGSSTLTSCLGGQQAHALGCLRSHDPSAGYLAVAGFWLVWLGVAGVALGLLLSGRHFTQRALTAGGAAYAVLVADLVIPFVSFLLALPGARIALALAPLLAVLSAVLVYAGARDAGPRGS